MKLLNLAFIILVIFLTSCMVGQNVVVEVKYSPKMSLKPDSNTILLINRVDLSRTKTSSAKEFAVVKASAFSAVRYAELHLKQLPNVKVINNVDSAAFNVNTDSIKSLASKYHSDYVLALNDFHVNVDLSALNAGSYYSINAAVNFILYEGNGIYYKRLTGKVDDHQDEGDDWALLADMIVRPTIKANKEAVIAASRLAAEDALKDYLQHSVIHKRPLYTDAWLQPAVKELLKGNFNKADSLLQPFLKDKNAQMVSKAAYTLAIVYESEGDINAAIDLARLSFDKFNNEYADILLSDLNAE